MEMDYVPSASIRNGLCVRIVPARPGFYGVKPYFLLWRCAPDLRLVMDTETKSFSLK
ncbi:MAG: hypothetical protein ACI9R3_002207 [Verrucomicrobiales bacterium]|jgi:hypothetical protein